MTHDNFLSQVNLDGGGGGEVRGGGEGVKVELSCVVK
jgi:hypothetical protein